MLSMDVRRQFRVKHAALLMLAAFTVGALSHPYQGETRRTPQRILNATSACTEDAAASRKAFLEAYKVFMHPRCMNCHPAGDVPLQGDDSRLHAQNVKRSKDGKGKFALKCANCHQETNLPGEHLPPGNPNWHLTPPEMPMVFQGKSARELAEQLKDPKRNGGKTLEQILHHVTEDKLVLWGWDPGVGRTKPPLTHAEFTAKMREWIEKGAAVPE